MNPEIELEMTDALPCVVCHASNLDELLEYRNLPRVTSDCKPWAAGGRLFVCRDCGTIQKKADTIWLNEIGEIYRGYEIYNLSGGAEQVIFDPAGTPRARSRVLVDFVASKLDGSSHGHLIDLGCGNGSALANFSEALPGWRFSGSELSDKAAAKMSAIRGFDKLYTGKVRGSYDVVSMIHSLEHMTSPHESLLEAVDVVKFGGKIFIEVPDAETSPFDFLVADHLTHFTQRTLSGLARSCGIEPEIVRNDLLQKENTLFGRVGKIRSSAYEPADGVRIARSSIDWITRIMEAATDLASRQSAIGIFGTSISAMWLYGAFRDHVEFFVDEDKSRIGQSYEGRPILAPDQVPVGASVFVPLSHEIAQRVAGRLKGGPANYVLPPAMGKHFP